MNKITNILVLLLLISFILPATAIKHASASTDNATSSSGESTEIKILHLVGPPTITTMLLHHLASLRITKKILRHQQEDPLRTKHHLMILQRIKIRHLASLRITTMLLHHLVNLPRMILVLEILNSRTTVVTIPHPLIYPQQVTILEMQMQIWSTTSWPCITASALPLEFSLSYGVTISPLVPRLGPSISQRPQSSLTILTRVMWVRILQALIHPLEYLLQGRDSLYGLPKRRIIMAVY